MTKNQYREIRPIVENLMAFILYLRFGTTMTPMQCLVTAKIFTTQFEQEFHFDE